MNFKKIEWKTPALVWGAMSVILFFAFFYSAFNNHFAVDYQAAIPGNSNFAEAYYTVYISPALAFAKTWSVLRVLGLLIWLGLAVAFIMAANDMIGKKQYSAGGYIARNFQILTFLVMIVAAAFIFASSSNKVAGNEKKIVPAATYELIKDDNNALEALFK